MHLVMFDIDGTLTQSNDVDADCFAEAIEEVLKLPPIDRDWSRYRQVTDSGITAEIIETRFERQPLNGELETIRRRFIERLEVRLIADPLLCRPVNGAAKMLAQLSDRGDVAIALATGGWGESAKLKCCTAGLRVERFALASADDSKSREEIMALARNRAAYLCGLSGFDGFIYVGDGLWDWRASCALGVPFVGIAGGESAEVLLAAGATTLLRDFTDYPRFVEMLGLNSDRSSADREAHTFT
jgi:phosphoglycolate phosphatase-like HAD superfamily hydrolase